MTYQKPKGTVDFFPEEMEVRNKIFNSLIDTTKRYNFKEIDSPAFETLELLTKKEGDEIKNQIFTLEKKGKESFGLRFDFTVPNARLVIEKQKVLPKPIKWFSIGKLWRYEQPQSGRLREFFQLNCEVFGSDKPNADAEVISLAIDCLKSFGLTSNDFFVKINNRKLLQGLLLDIIDKKQLDKTIAIIDKGSKISKEEFNSELKKINLSKSQISKINDLLVKKLSQIKTNNDLANEGLKELKEVIKLLNSKKEFIKFDLSTARGLAYYTGTVFEIFDKKGKYRSLAGGGRYDKMIEMFDGVPCPATGFGLGYSTLSLLLEEKNLIPKIDLSPDFYIAVVSNKEMPKAIEIANKLREKYTVEIDVMQRKLGKQFNYANAISAKKVIIIGEEEIKSGKLTIKDMKTGKQEKKLLKNI